MTGLFSTHSRDRPIGVVDSGIGGLSVLRALRRELPNERYLYFADTPYFPYGPRSEEELQRRLLEVSTHLIHHEVKMIVVACNTATAAALSGLQESGLKTYLVGTLPPVERALALSTSGRIAVLATVLTTRSAALRAAVEAAGPAAVHLQPCPGLAEAIESRAIGYTRRLIKHYLMACGPFGHGPGLIDTVVLGCTHYALVSELFEEQLPEGVRLVDSANPVCEQVSDLLERLNMESRGRGELTILGSPEYQAKALAWL